MPLILCRNERTACLFGSTYHPVVAFTGSSRLVFVQYGNDALIHLYIVTIQYFFLQAVIKRAEEIYSGTVPSVDSGGGKLYTLSLEYLNLAVVRLVILILAYKQVCQERGAGVALRQWNITGKTAYDDPVTVLERILLTDNLADIEDAGNVLKNFSGFLSNVSGTFREISGSMISLLRSR